jgi:hypothetical protein
MFGTIGHAKVKPGHNDQILNLLGEWKTSIRPKVPGSFIELAGRPVDRQGETVFVALAKDEKTYRDLAAMPEQDAFYHRMLEHLESEPTWEDVEMDVIVRE